MKFLFILFQHLVPHHLLSRLVGKLASATTPWLKNFLIRRFINNYRVNMEEALHSEPHDFKHFNDFFTRELKPGARNPDLSAGTVISPADGAISAIGDIHGDSVFQAKGRDFSLSVLLGSEADATAFLDGSFVTVYLSPKDYHRVHMPMAGTLRSMRYIPGRLFSVNQTTAESIDSLFARNERAVCLFETDAGPMAVILVGAMIVAGIETVWSGQVAPSKFDLSEHDYTMQHPAIQLGKGEEMGRFKLGSTAIVLFGPGAARWTEELGTGASVRMGETIGHTSPDSPV